MAGSNTFGGTIRLDGESDYRKALKNISAQLGVVSTEMQKVSTEFGKNDNSVASLTKKDDLLNKRLEVQKEQVALLRGALEQSKEEYGENDTRTLKWQQSLNKAEAEVTKTSKEIDELGQNLNDAGNKAVNSSEGFTVFKGVLANLATDAIRGALNGIKNLGSSILDVGKQAVSSYADYEQLTGGVETLFKDSAGIVENYANNAYKTSGLSANEYMETVTSFSASLLSSLNGDTKKSAEVADMAITDMSDNANKMGTDMSLIQNAYQGFAKQNYTMLDNLKLGYGGTKTEMERLLSDAEKISGVHYDISNLNDVYQAIHVIQGEMGITGTTAEEASTTIQGSVASMKSAWQNLLTGIADGDSDWNTLINNFVDSVVTAGENILPRIGDTVEGIGLLITDVLGMLAGQVLPLGMELIQNIITGMTDMMPDIVSSLSNVLGVILNGLMSMLPQILEMGIQIIVSLIQGIAQSLPTLIPQIVNVVITLVDTLLDNIDIIIDAGIQLIMGLATGLINALPQLIDKIPEIIDKLVMALTNNLPKLIDMGIKLAVQLGIGLVKAIPQLISKIPQIISSLVKGFANYYSKVGEIGLNIIKGILNGFSSAGNIIWEAIKKVGNSMIKGIKKFFGIHSPATNKDLVFSSRMVAQGFGNAFVDEMKSVQTQMTNAIPSEFNITPRVTSGFDNRMVIDSGNFNNENGSNGGNFNVTINNNSRYTSSAENARLFRREYELYLLKNRKV